MTLPRPSVRYQLLFHHEVLRALLGRLADAAERTASGQPAAQDLRDAARSLHAVMEAHVNQEEQLLEPFFRRHSPKRLAQLRADHRRGLEMLRKLRQRPSSDAAAGYRRLVPVLMAAIERESRDILEPDLPQAQGECARHPTRNTA
jgi:iron-sulfur cluster repair protein YtfE (RIC family)